MKALVTGSSRGLGKQIVKVFAYNNIDVIINYNKSEKEAIELYNELKKIVNVQLIKCDISNEEEVMMMFNKIDKLDILVNNAGISIDNDPINKSKEEFNKVIDVNLTGTFLVSKYAIKKMNKGVIINISSTNAIDTNYPESIDYDASKAGIISLTHNFSKYLTDIRVNCICPDWMDTEMNNDMDLLYKKSINFLNTKDVAQVVYNISMNKDINDLILRLDNKNINEYK